MTSTTSPAAVPARPWLSADARRWAAVRLPGWARPLWCASVLVVAAIVMLAPFGWDDRCTVAAPCGPDWWYAVGAAGFFVHALWLFALPEVALVSAPLLLLWMTDPGFRADGAAGRVADAAVVAALCWGWAAAFVRSRVRREQRALALEAAGGVLLPVPEQAAPVRRGVVRIALGLAGLVVAAVAAGVAVSGERADRAHAAAAVRVEAVVVANGAEDHVVARFGDGTRHRVGVTLPEEHEIGAPVPVLVDGGWRRFAAEPYEDRTGPRLLALTAGGAGVTLLLSGAVAALRARAVRRGPVPVLRVLADRADGRTVIRPVDGADAPPVLAYHAVGAGAWARGECVLFGLPAEGAVELVLVGATASGDVVVGTADSPVRRWTEPAAEPGPDAEGRRQAEHRREAEARVAEAAAAMKPGAGPLRWRGGTAGRVAAAAALLGEAAVLASDPPFDEGWWQCVGWVLGAWWFASVVLSPVTWRITADATGLRVRGCLRTRHVPWADVTRVVRTLHGELIVRRVAGQEDLSLGVVVLPWWERKLRRPSAATRAAAELTAMARDPGMRP
ncbi:PH domain-containing protein [Streptomyces sp. NPDC026673]|uniref:PH domain-containing protein n=1 Tax=Streptomyces sp. NPDC026673 TaxID=3155724 RepID=UPI0033F71569